MKSLTISLLLLMLCSCGTAHITRNGYKQTVRYKTASHFGKIKSTANSSREPVVIEPFHLHSIELGSITTFHPHVYRDQTIYDIEHISSRGNFRSGAADSSIADYNHSEATYAIQNEQDSHARSVSRRSEGWKYLGLSALSYILFWVLIGVAWGMTGAGLIVVQALAVFAILMALILFIISLKKFRSKSEKHLDSSTATITDHLPLQPEAVSDKASKNTSGGLFLGLAALSFLLAVLLISSGLWWAYSFFFGLILVLLAATAIFLIIAIVKFIQSGNRRRRPLF